MLSFIFFVIISRLSLSAIIEASYCHGFGSDQWLAFPWEGISTPSDSYAWSINHRSPPPIITITITTTIIIIISPPSSSSPSSSCLLCLVDQPQKLLLKTFCAIEKTENFAKLTKNNTLLNLGRGAWLLLVVQ